MLIAISTYLKPLSEIDPHRPAHLAFLKKLIDDKVILIAGRQDPATGAIIIANIDSTESFLNLLKNDPYIQYNLAEYKFIKFTPVVYAELLKDTIC